MRCKGRSGTRRVLSLLVLSPLCTKEASCLQQLVYLREVLASCVSGPSRADMQAAVPITSKWTFATLFRQTGICTAEPPPARLLSSEAFLSRRVSAEIPQKSAAAEVDQS